MSKRIWFMAVLTVGLTGVDTARVGAIQTPPVPVTVVVGALPAGLNCTVQAFTCAAANPTSGACTTEVPGATGLTTMNFGTLVNAVAGNPSSALTSTNFFKVYCGISVNTGTYTVSQTGTALTNGAASIPNNAWVFNPIPLVNCTGTGCGPTPSGATFGAKVSANSSNALWYNSGSTGQGVVVQATYGIPGNPNQAVSTTGQLTPPTQPAGTYTGQVFWTLTCQPTAC